MSFSDEQTVRIEACRWRWLESTSRKARLGLLIRVPYTLGALNLRRRYVVALAILITTFVALYTPLESMGHCDYGGCPYAAHSSTTSGVVAVCLAAVLSASSVAVFAIPTLYRRRVDTTDLRPTQLYLSPDPHPPRLTF